MNRKKSVSLRIPLMSAFRAAAETRDGRKTLDLRDESGERVIAGRVVTGRAAMTEGRLRSELSRDLGLLLNTVNLESSVDLGQNEAVRRSILNYGLPDIAYRTIDEAGIEDIDQEIKDALLLYEPRLVRDTLHIERDRTVAIHQLAIRFVVRAEMVADPVNVPVEFFAELQAGSGKVAVSRV
jgi:type VI secretion system protein ImpF